MNESLLKQFGSIDIYLFDQILKGRFDQSKTILDVGCGLGRNMVYFLQNQFEVWGVDVNPGCIEKVKELSQQLAPKNPLSNFIVSKVESMPFTDGAFDIVVCSAVLHFAKNKNHFEEMLYETWRVLKPGGFIFLRLASDIGIEKLVKPIGYGVFLLPDGTERYLVNQQQLLDYAIELKAELTDPIKTTIVQNLRSMTTWCLKK